MKKVLFLSTLSIFVACRQKTDSMGLYESDTFSIYKDKIVQGENVAEVLSPTHLKSSYKSPASETFSRLIAFKFSINEKDNELPSGQDHWVIIGEEHESPVIPFGAQPEPMPDKPGTYLPTNYEYTIRVDVSAVLKQFEEKGYYEAFDGSRVAKADFKGIYVAGGSEPLSWDFVNLANKGLQLQPTDDPNIYSLTVKFNPYSEADHQDKEWQLTEDISQKPKYTSDQPIVDALFNLSLEEARKNIEPDSTLRTGAKWGGVWTRDVSYSILLAFAYHEPEVGKISLRKKVKRGRIIQDTGSGGAWPVSSDRTTWVLAAWEIYKVTGDQAWLDEVYPIIKNTLDDDYKTIYDPATGMYSGESSFLDWREQTYPKWMSNMDIYVSQNLGTNVVHYQAHRILAEMAQLKGDDPQVYLDRAEGIKKGINDYLWLKEQGYYAQYLYGRHDLIVSPRYEALGEALAILFGVADEERAKSILAKSPLTTFGATCIYPQIPGIPPYHNNGIWPFVQSYWNWAAAKTGNESVLNHGLAAVYRAAGLFLTNYENMVAQTGDFLGTEINSHRMLWSMAGNLAMVHRIFMGMEFELDGLYFKPVVPEAYGGTRTLSNFHYRNCTLNITVEGYGNEVKAVTLDGQAIEQPFIPANTTGSHELVITLTDKTFPQQEINLVDNHFTLPTVQAAKEGISLKWQPVKGAVHYRIYQNGKFLHTTTNTRVAVDVDRSYHSYQVSAVDAQGYEGFACEPVVFAKSVQLIELEKVATAAALPYTNYSGEGFVAVSLSENRDIQLELDLPESGNYLLDIRYSNGNGPWNTDNKCAIRSLTVNGNYEGVFIFPQRGQDEWSDWGFSNSREVRLKQGPNTIKLHF
ncbi:MAG: hypothetical protein KDC44_08775, partial [Phaeodactylibacter sp.]|nr:hypothetical protein [Phaeodactylibacter sp.]